MHDIDATCDRFVKWGLVGLMIFTPFAFGTVEPWSIAFMEWGVVALLLTGVLGSFWAEASARARPWRLTGMEIPIGLFLVFCLLQTVPLPSSWLKILSPGSARMYQSVDLANWQASSEVGRKADEKAVSLLRVARAERRPISLQPRVTWDRVQMLASLGLLFTLVALWGARADRIVFLLGALVTVGFFVAVQGLVQYLTWNGKVLWFRKVPPSYPFGPFVNHDHFAGYVEMIIPVAISLALFLADNRLHASGQWALPSKQTSMGSLISRDPNEGGRLGKTVMSFFAAVILVVTLFFSQSLGGIISTAISGLVFFLLIGRRLVTRRLAWAVGAAIPPVVLALVLWIGPDEVKSQFGASSAAAKETSFGLRVMIWNSLLHNLRPYFWTGAGLGTFELSFAPFTPPGSGAHWDRAHNDYLQLLWEAGLIGFLLVLGALLVFVRRYWWPALRSRGHPLDLFRVALAVSLLSIGLHSLVDFNLQIGANAFLCSLLAGALVALHHCVEEETARRPLLVTLSR